MMSDWYFVKGEYVSGKDKNKHPYEVTVCCHPSALFETVKEIIDEPVTVFSIHNIIKL